MKMTVAGKAIMFYKHQKKMKVLHFALRNKKNKQSYINNSMQIIPPPGESDNYLLQKLTFATNSAYSKFMFVTPSNAVCIKV